MISESKGGNHRGDFSATNRASTFDEEVERWGRPTHCQAILSDASVTRVAIARRVGLDGVRVRLQPEEASGLRPGHTIHLNLEEAPVGPIRTMATVISINPDQDDQGNPVSEAWLDFVDLSESQRRFLQERLRSVAIVILTVGLDRPLEYSVPGVRVVDTEDVVGVLSHLEQEHVAVLVLGSRLSPSMAHTILSRVFAEYPESPMAGIVLGAGQQPAVFQDFINADRLFYMARAGVTGEQLQSILGAAVHHFETRLDGTAPQARNSLASDRILDFCTRLSVQEDLPNTAGLLMETVRELLGADRAQCLVYDADKEALLSPSAAGEDAQVESPAAGLVGYIARTGDSVQLDRSGEDPRYEAEADDPGGGGDAQYLAAPVFGTAGEVVAVVSAMRNLESPRFGPGDVRMLALLAYCSGPMFTVLRWKARVQELLQHRSHLERIREVFRAEALEHHSRSWTEEGDLLQAPPSWLKRTHWIIVVALVTGLLYLMLGRVSATVTGPVVIRARNKIAVSTLVGGLAGSPEVWSGDRVRRGDLLLHLYDPGGNIAPERLREQLRAPGDGVVSGLRVRAGQLVNAGDQLASIINEQSGYEMIAFLPGSFAPQFRPGMACMVKLVGYPDTHEAVVITQVSPEIIGPGEAARFAGKDSADALGVSGPVVILRSLQLPSVFRSGTREYSFRDGMIGQGELTVASEPLLVNLFPGLKGLWKN